MPVNLAYRSYQLLWEVLDWLYPPHCGGCGNLGTRWCSDCAQNTSEIVSPVCPVCGNPGSASLPCQRCTLARPSYTAIRSYAEYNGVIREAIHRYKYKHDIGLGEALARPMIMCLQKLNWSLDIITSVPLGLARFKQRGYNQANFLARPIALSMQRPFMPRLLSRTRETKSQVGLTVGERQENMRDAFKGKGRLLQDRTVLVVDDVATSGATINSCAQALLDQGAARVYGFTLARAVFLPDGNIDIS